MLKRFAESGAAPGGSEPEENAAGGVEGCKEKRAGAQRVERLPVKRGEGAVGANEADGGEVAPGRIDLNAFAKEREGKPDDHAGREIDDEGAKWEPDADTTADGRPHPIARHGSERSSQANEQIPVQSCSPFDPLACFSALRTSGGSTRAQQQRTTRPSHTWRTHSE